MTEERCENCRFRINLRCKRYPPKPATESDEDVNGDYYVTHGFMVPVMADNDWCGEWQPKRESEGGRYA